jgi:hypothetical protein
VSPDLTVASLTDEWSSEITDIRRLEGSFDSDPSSKLAITKSEGPMLLLMTVRDDVGELISSTGQEKATHADVGLPVEQPYKLYGKPYDA